VAWSAVGLFHPTLHDKAKIITVHIRVKRSLHQVFAVHINQHTGQVTFSPLSLLCDAQMRIHLACILLPQRLWHHAKCSKSCMASKQMGQSSPGLILRCVTCLVTGDFLSVLLSLIVCSLPRTMSLISESMSANCHISGLPSGTFNIFKRAYIFDNRHRIENSLATMRLICFNPSTYNVHAWALALTSAGVRRA